MIRIASERTERRKGMAASRQEDAATWPTNKPPSKVARARSTQAAQREIESAAVKIPAPVRTMPHISDVKGRAGQGAKFPAPLTHKHHGTDNKKEDTLQTAGDVTLLTTRYALLGLVSAMCGVANVANEPLANSVANSVANDHSAPSPRKPVQAATTALLTAEGGEKLTESLVNVARTKSKPRDRRVYQRKLMAKRRAAERVANVIV